MNNWEHLADVLVNYSTGIQPNEKVLITMMEVDTFPLARAVYAASVKAGALPHIEFQSTYLERDLMLYGNPEQLDWVPEMQAYGMEWADVYIGLRGARNPHEFTGISASKITAHKRAMGKVSGMRNDLTRWVLVRVPNESFAQQAEMSLDDMMAFFFSATVRDWQAESRRYQEIKDIFQAAKHVRIVGRDTDLTFSTQGRIYEVADGHLNMPDGEIFTAPVDDSAEGYIYFEFPGVYVGRQVKGIQLEFSKGQVVRATAESNQELLDELLNMDEGAKRLGEFGVGTNFGIDRFCYDILYDEKIGGTIHLALGRAYAECGGVNQSALHWDIIKDLRREGAVYLDGAKVIDKGMFLI
ncbi:MAG: aminopeptidase [Chloroflexi bacterium OLB15]|nr:MAG: aminopeptidase [Chloroflexi bacterium OLB15]